MEIVYFLGFVGVVSAIASLYIVVVERRYDKMSKQ